LLGYKKEYFEIGYSKTSQPPRHIILTGFSRLLIFGNSYILGYRQDSQELWVPYALYIRIQTGQPRTMGSLCYRAQTFLFYKLSKPALEPTQTRI